MTSEKNLRLLKTRVLCVDVGNSVTKYAIGNGSTWSQAGFHPTPALHSRRSAAAALRRSLRLGRGVEAIAVSSVVPSVNRLLGDVLARITGLEPFFVDSRNKLPFSVGRRHREGLGIDRVCAAVGAAETSLSAIVIDAGSAITVDLLSRGKYEGGYILAGPRLALRSLVEHTEQLPSVDPDGALPRLSRSTERAMWLGAWHGTAGAVKEAVRQIEVESGHRPRKFLTGGASRRLSKWLPTTWTRDPLLVAKGLRSLWVLNAATV